MASFSSLFQGIKATGLFIGKASKGLAPVMAVGAGVAGGIKYLTTPKQSKVERFLSRNGQTIAAVSAVTGVAAPMLGALYKEFFSPATKAEAQAAATRAEEDRADRELTREVQRLTLEKMRLENDSKANDLALKREAATMESLQEEFKKNAAVLHADFMAQFDELTKSAAEAKEAQYAAEQAQVALRAELHQAQAQTAELNKALGEAMNLNIEAQPGPLNSKRVRPASKSTRAKNKAAKNKAAKSAPEASNDEVPQAEA